MNGPTPRRCTAYVVCGDDTRRCEQRVDRASGEMALCAFHHRDMQAGTKADHAAAQLDLEATIAARAGLCTERTKDGRLCPSAGRHTHEGRAVCALHMRSLERAR